MANQTLKQILAGNTLATLDGTEAVYGTQSPTGTPVDAGWLNSTLKAYVLATPTITGHPTIEGVTSTGATGTGALVFATSPTLVTPVIGAAVGTSLRLGAVSSATGSLALANSGSAFLTTIQAGNAAAARTYTWPTDFGAAGTVLTDAAGNGTLSWAAGGGGAGLGANTFTDLQTITQATANHGIIASTGYSLTGSNATNMLDFAGTWNTSGAPTALKINITNTASGTGSLLVDLQVGGASKLSVNKLGGLITYSGSSEADLGVKVGTSGFYTNGNSLAVVLGNSFVQQYFDYPNTTTNFHGLIPIGFSPGIPYAAAIDTILSRKAAATWQLGTFDAAAPVAQTLGVQSVVAGNANNAGANWTLTGSLSNGSGASGDIIFKTGDKGAASGTQNGLNAALTLKGGTATGKSGSVVFGSAAIATNATDGFIYFPTCAGTPTGVPTAFTGRAAMIFDTSNNQFWIYDGAWLQPKTAGAVSLVSWQ